MAEIAEEASARRREAAKALLRLRAASRDIRDWLPNAVVVVLAEDPVGATFEHLAQHHPDGVHLARVVDGSRVEVVEVRRCDQHDLTGEHVAEDTPIHPDAEIGMLFDYLRSFPGRRLHCIAALPEYEVAIADDGGMRDLSPLPPRSRATLVLSPAPDSTVGDAALRSRPQHPRSHPTGPLAVHEAPIEATVESAAADVACLALRQAGFWGKPDSDIEMPHLRFQHAAEAAAAAPDEQQAFDVALELLEGAESAEAFGLIP